MRHAGSKPNIFFITCLSQTINQCGICASEKCLAFTEKGACFLWVTMFSKQTQAEQCYILKGH